MSTPAEVLSAAGISAFGLSMPTLSPVWTDGTLPGEDAATMKLTLSSGSWVSPAASVVTVSRNAELPVTLIDPTGVPVQGPGVLITLFDRVRLRLARLYAQLLEDPATARPEAAEGLPFRPVPAYFFIAGAPPSGLKGGKVKPGEDLGVAGDFTVYDDDGMPIDPIAVAAIFTEFMLVHNVLQSRPVSTPFDSTFQLQDIVALATTTEVRLRLSDFSGEPYDGNQLSGITAVSAGSGLFSLDAAGGGGSGLDGTITKNAATAASGSFPPAVHRLLKLGPSTTGRLTDGPVTFPALPAGRTLDRDFFSVRVVELGKTLIGEPDTGFNVTELEDAPTVRTNEALRLLPDGNDVLGASSAALSGVLTERLCVAQAINARFPLAPQVGLPAHWPQFPTENVAPAPAGPLPIGLRNELDLTAHFFDDGDPATANTDVVLSLQSLPAEASIRVYPRDFVADAREERGDGAGTIVAADGTAQLLLRDPLSLRTPGIAENAIVVPTEANLRFDLIVVKRTNESRMYGNLVVPITAAQTTAPPLEAENTLGLADRRGVSNAGVLGLGSTGTLPSDPLQAALALAGEGTPRDAPRLPTMARRELLVASIDSGGVFSGVISGGRIDRETHSADTALGAPGGLGGRETQSTGVATRGGRLAFDVARTAFRRTTHIVQRLPALADSEWDEPSERPEPSIDTPAGPDVGTFSGAVLQTIAPFCETPEFQPLDAALDLSDLPPTFDALVDEIIDALPGGTPGRAQLVSALNGLKDNDTLNESTLERLYNELKRDLVASAHGRRDAQWALQAALSRARHCVYIESPGFAPTAAPGPLEHKSVDLESVINERMTFAQGLRVIVCTPKHPDFGPGYEPLAAHEAAERRKALLGLPTAREPEPRRSRVVGFHPIGFPGRPSRIETTTVIVDDVWAMVGSSTFRRRGLTFDGGADLVLSDSNLRGGVSPAIRDFRRQIMAKRLGISGEVTAGFADPDFVRLGDVKEAAFVVRERLRSGGQGKISGLWNGKTPGVPQLDPDSVTMDVANPEGREFDIASALALAGIAALGRF